MKQANGKSHQSLWAVVGAVFLIAIIAVGLFGLGAWSEIAAPLKMAEPTRQLHGEIFGAMPKPTQPPLSEPLVQMVQPPSRLQKMLVKRIPTIAPGAKMPHPFWGSCTNCHLIQGGAPPGSQPATPVAKVWEQVSAYYKVGPPILPNSNRPHPPSGRCIKCHDVLVYVQIK